MAQSCESGTYCDETSKTCKKKGSQGSSCQRTYNTHRNTVHNPCADSLGLYCKRTKEDSVPDIVPGTCVRKVTGGETSDAGACSGFLIKVGKNATSACMPHGLEGQPCRKNTQCRGEMRAGSTRSDTICNWVDKEMGLLPRYGVCAKERDLIRTVGAPCTPGLDLCDARRDLRCEKRGGKHVCVQNGGFIPHGHTHCTPRSMFSKCPGQVCRQLTETISEVPFGPFLCLRATESLKQGEICSSAEHTHCGKGLECVTVDGLQEDFPIQTAYCILRVNEGEECSQWHRTTCGEGTSCITGKCDKSNDQPSLVAMSFSGKDAPCLKVPCAPGMICSISRKRCELPEKVVELGSVCGASSPVYKVSVASDEHDWPRVVRKPV